MKDEQLSAEKATPLTPEHCGWCHQDYDFHSQSSHCPHESKITVVSAEPPDKLTEPALTAEELDAFSELLEKVTPGPWERSGPTRNELAKGINRCYVHRVPGCGSDDIPPEKFFISIQSVGTQDRDYADADFIAAARNIAPRLVAQVKADAELIAELQTTRFTLAQIEMIVNNPSLNNGLWDTKQDKAAASLRERIIAAFTYAVEGKDYRGTLAALAKVEGKESDAKT